MSAMKCPLGMSTILEQVAFSDVFMEFLCCDHVVVDFV